MEKNKRLSKLYHTFNCIICGREQTLYCVGEPFKDVPCSMKCRKIQAKQKEK